MPTPKVLSIFGAIGLNFTTMPRPTIPDWIRAYPPPSGWTNVFSLLPSNDRIYGTETLFGDWDSRMLLLAKDWAPTWVLRDRIEKGDPDPWRHGQRELGDSGGYRTNEWLCSAAAEVREGKLYGSATAHVLCDDSRWSRSLPGFYAGPLHEHLKRVLAWVIASMSNLEVVACLGAEAWSLANTVLDRSDAATDFRGHRDACRVSTGTCAGKQITAFALYHPAARVSDEAKRRGWRYMREAVENVAQESRHGEPGSLSRS